MSAADFALELKAEWFEKVDDIKETIQLIGITAVHDVVLKTPVDTGRARNNWFVGIGESDLTTTEEVDPSGGSAINGATVVMGRYPEIEGFPFVDITNNLPYAERLEQGHSMQAPAGMVGLTVAEIEAQFDGKEV